VDDEGHRPRVLRVRLIGLRKNSVIDTGPSGVRHNPYHCQPRRIVVGVSEFETLAKRKPCGLTAICVGHGCSVGRTAHRSQQVPWSRQFFARLAGRVCETTGRTSSGSRSARTWRCVGCPRARFRNSQGTATSAQRSGTCTSVRPRLMTRLASSIGPQGQPIVETMWRRRVAGSVSSGRKSS
jgi:hypothetical protein